MLPPKSKEFCQSLPFLVVVEDTRCNYLSSILEEMFWHSSDYCIPENFFNVSVSEDRGNEKCPPN